ncbi:MAG: D-cysteine desulfhydrase family protein [Synergistaceae bacterium]|nr:D-cysteine desulfhydrase family protein [Synergistaceae bacterium]
MKDINDFKRVGFGLLPTPFYKLENISKRLGHNVFIKRDDMTGVSLGGNKVRKLEYLLADAQSKGCDYVLTAGGPQSNHAMLTAACANRIGIKSILVLKKRGVTDKRGNLVLDDILGADVRFVDSDSYDDVYAEMHRIEDKLKADGHNPYFVPVGGSVPLGALGYIGCAKEIFEQSKTAGITPDRIVSCVGSGGTYAGLALGAKLYSPGTKVTGVGVSDDLFEEIVLDLMRGASELLESDKEITESDIDIKYCFGKGYSIPSPEGTEAITMLAHEEGLIIDPVYTGKTFAGMLNLIREGYFRKDENIIFVHTGGAAALFAMDLA